MSQKKQSDTAKKNNNNNKGLDKVCNFDKENGFKKLTKKVLKILIIKIDYKIINKIKKINNIYYKKDLILTNVKMIKILKNVLFL